MTTVRNHTRMAPPRIAFALFALGRATLGLFLHGLRRPGSPAIIDRQTGKVGPQ